MPAWEPLIHELLGSREGSICPSDVARHADPARWRAAMPEVHATVDRLLAAGSIAVSQRGMLCAARPSGAYRIQRSHTRRLILVFGDQLDRNSALLRESDPKQDRIFMAEVADEANHVWNHKARIAIFLAAMRHFRDDMQSRGWRVDYHTLDDPSNRGSLEAEAAAAIDRWQPDEVHAVEPGEHRLLAIHSRVQFHEDRHFLCTREQFRAHAENRKQLRMEFFYREMRQRHGVLMDGAKPVGGDWNYDEENRGSFPKAGPGLIPAPISFEPDAVTRDVLALVEQRFAEHPGSLAHFDWAVTPEQASAAFDDFLQNRLAQFGLYQDAMWTGEPYLYHSRISSALNLKLLDPLDVIRKVEQHYRSGRVPLPAAEGFIRQILGWREYVRGVYWHFMPQYIERNELDAHLPLPPFYWTGGTEMNCLRHAIGQTLDFGYAHHIQRLMVTGLFTLLLGVEPRQVHEWYLAVYVDAVEWVELPNATGMSQYSDGGVMASKPYIASGKYIQRMSNYCSGCRFDPGESTGATACPFTTLYWDFLMRHEDMLRGNRRMTMQVRNLDRLSAQKKEAIRRQAGSLKIELCGSPKPSSS